MRSIVDPGNIEIGVEAKDWQEAVRAAGDILWKNGYVRQHYVDGMVETVKTLGPYIVIGPGLAMPHSKRGDDVIKSGVSIVSLAHPINFGNKANDPVYLVVGLAGADDDLHLDILQMIADLFEDEKAAYRIAQLNSKDEIAKIFNEAGE